MTNNRIPFLMKDCEGNKTRISDLSENRRLVRAGSGSRVDSSSRSRLPDAPAGSRAERVAAL